MESMLCLNDDCLCAIVSCIDDFSSFYNFALTCKRFYHATMSHRNWHINVMKRKAEFYSHDFMVYNVDPADWDDDLESDPRYLKKERLNYFLTKARDHSKENRPSYPEVVEIWEAGGPAAATLFTWIIQRSSLTPSGMKLYNREIYLPSCGQVIFINWTIHKQRDDGICRAELEVFYDTKLKVDIEIDVQCFTHERMDLIKPLNPIVDILQKEFGDTEHLITAKFFSWFCLYPLFPICQCIRNIITLKEKDKVYFKDKSRNVKPTTELVQQQIKWHRKKKRLIFQNYLREWMKEKENSHSAYMIAQVVEILVENSQTDIIAQLQCDVLRFSHVLSNIDGFIKNVPQNVLFNLFNRSTELPSSIHNGNKIIFRIKGEEFVKIEVHHQVGMGFTMLVFNQLPDGQKIKIPFYDGTGLDLENHQRFMKQFNPITEIVQECIDKCMIDDENNFKITDLFTAVYFMLLVKFSSDSLQRYCAVPKEDIVLLPATQYPRRRNYRAYFRSLYDSIASFFRR